MENIRLEKYLSERGVAARRKCAELVAAGRVCVNGQAVREPGIRITPGKDAVAFDGRPIDSTKRPTRTIMLHKPRGFICSATTRQGRTVYEFIPGVRERVVPVGRLDKDSEGLLLMSDDGGLVLTLTHPRYGHSKIYRVSVSGNVTEKTLAQLRSRMTIDGYCIQPPDVRLLRASRVEGRQVLEFVLKEGRSRQIRKMCDRTGLRIHRLVRTAVGSLRLGSLKPGEWRDLTPAEIEALLACDAETSRDSE